MFLIFRKNSPSFNSIENVFNTIIPYLNYPIQKIELPYTNSGVLNRIKNILYVYKNFANEVIHITGHDHYIAFGRKKQQTILTIHDIEFIKRSKGIKRFLLKKLWMDWPIANAGVITTISEFSKKEILSLNNYKTPIKVIYNPLTLPIQPKEKLFNTACPNILHIGTKENKNLPRLIKALEGINCQLTIIGTISFKIKELLSNHQINYISKKNLSNEEMILEYENCDLLTFISTYEGFGLPIIEAQAIGRVVISSNTSSIPEIARDSALLVDPFNIKEIRNGIENLINNETLRSNYINLGFENIKRFQPQEIANKYLQLYKSIQ